MQSKTSSSGAELATALSKICSISQPTSAMRFATAQIIWNTWIEVDST